MIVNDLKYSDNINTILPLDENGREISVYGLHNVEMFGSLYYPNPLVFSHDLNKLFNPIRERTMSLPNEQLREVEITSKQPSSVEDSPVFFLIYNTDNYYHFIYDTLPYLISFNILKRDHPDLKLLVSYPNKDTNLFYDFVLEFFELLGVEEKDLILADSNTLYRKMFVSSSYTHDIDSNLPPRQEIYELYRDIASKVTIDKEYPKRIYISRRSWIHNDYSNIGTNYTTRRELTNETELVESLQAIGYTEVFTELLSTREKIAMFKQATDIVGPIGGGLCNVLFCGTDTNLVSIVSPFFLDINSRFRYSFDKVNTRYFMDTRHIENSRFKKYMRVRVKGKGITGEIENINGNMISVAYDKDGVSGWNAQSKYKNITVSARDLESIDPGLNSAWTINMTNFKKECYNA